MEQKREIVLVGDIHGRWGTVFNRLREHDLRHTYLIAVGDIDLLFREPGRIDKLNEEFRVLDIEFIGIHGNHDDPSYFDGSVNLSNFKLIPDYSVLELNGENFLFIGGAISIDRMLRVEGEDYWREERIKEGPIPNKKIDVIITHDCPNHVGLSCATLWDDIGNPVKTDAFKGRQILDKVYACIQPRKWYYGHYHQPMFHKDEKTTFKCLDICEIILYD
jgi:DNA repair exonuclease SbcCD nuclease subunit